MLTMYLTSLKDMECKVLLQIMTQYYTCKINLFFSPTGNEDLISACQKLKFVSSLWWMKVREILIFLFILHSGNISSLHFPFPTFALHPDWISFFPPSWSFNIFFYFFIDSPLTLHIISWFVSFFSFFIFSSLICFNSFSFFVFHRCFLFW